MGVATTASQGTITQEELQLRPVYRVGQLLETTPGLVVTVHSGEGKAQQYLVRGFNLDHGTDIANFVDDMPVNRSTNTHGQGYSDANFMMPEVFNGLDYTKGPYHAEIGDFGAVASTHVKMADEIPNQMSLSAGTLGVYNAFAGGTLQDQRHGPNPRRGLPGARGWPVRPSGQLPQDRRRHPLQPRRDRRRLRPHSHVLQGPGEHDDGPAAAGHPAGADRPVRHAGSVRWQLFRAHQPFQPLRHQGRRRQPRAVDLRRQRLRHHAGGCSSTTTSPTSWTIR